MTAAALLWTGCRDYEADDITGDPVKVDLAFTFSSDLSDSKTRQGSDVMDGSGRTISIQRIVPLIGDEPSVSLLGAMQDPVDKEDNSTDPVTKAKFFYYANCILSRGVNGCLVYGQADDFNKDNINTTKAYNGRLTSHIPNPVQSVNDISFALEPIYDEDVIPENAATLANHLNAIAGAEGWKTAGNEILKNLYKNFINHGNDLPGSASSVKAWIKSLKAALNELTFANSEDQAIKEAILTKITERIGSEETASLGTYPQDMGLPDGAAAIRWAEWKDENNATQEGFKPQLQTTTLDNINSVSRFTYPAALHFFVNSPIRTSNEPVTFTGVYDPENVKTWAKVLESYRSDTKITSQTEAVALEDPVQYAVAQLKINVKAELGQGASGLTHAGSTEHKPDYVEVGGTRFPLKGVIVCGQREVNYQFEPRNNYESDVKFIYDNQVNNNCYLSTENQEGCCTTLVLQSNVDENVNIILEFENKSGKSFKCVDGTVYPDTRFYLIGEINAANGKPSSISEEATSEETPGVNRVFTKDHITVVNLKVVSLAKAYNVLPNILSSNLEIGVMTAPQWIAAEPTSVKLN